MTEAGGIYKSLKIPDSAIKSRNDKQYILPIYEFINVY